MSVFCFFFSSRRRHTRCALVTGVQTCALPIFTIRSTPTGILRLFDRFDAGAFAETMVPVGRMIGALAVWLTGPSISGFLIAWAGAELLCAVAYWYLAL